MFATVNLGILTPGLFYIPTGLLDHVGGVEPAFEMSAAELAFFIFLVAGTLAFLFDLHFMFGKLWRSLRRCCSGQRLTSLLGLTARILLRITFYPSSDIQKSRGLVDPGASVGWLPG